MYNVFSFWTVLINYSCECVAICSLFWISNWTGLPPELLSKATNRVCGTWEPLGPEAGLEPSRFFEDELLQRLFGQVVQLHVELERSLGGGLHGTAEETALKPAGGNHRNKSGRARAPHLVRRVVILLQVRVGQGLLHLDPLVRVKRQHSVQKVQSCSTKSEFNTASWCRRPLEGAITSSK